MADTFADAWVKARLYLPAVPPMLVRDFCQDAYTRACRHRDWGFLRSEGILSFLASRSLTVGVTQGSKVVTSAAGFLAGDLGRQLNVGTFPVYSVATYTNASSLLLDQNYAGDTNTAATATIHDLYATMPADFDHFMVIADPYYQRPIPFWISEDQIGVGDPGRTVGGPLRYLVSHKLSTLTATLGQTQYEAWPAPTEARQYPYLYQRKSSTFADTDPLLGVFSNRADLLKLGAQLCAAEWPGTAALKNPYYSLQHAQLLHTQWDKELNTLGLADDTIFPSDLQQIDWTRYTAGIVAPSNWLRQTDATLDDYL